MKRFNKRRFKDEHIEEAYENELKNPDGFGHVKYCKRENTTEDGVSGNYADTDRKVCNLNTETIVYYESILKDIKQGLRGESKDTFAQNVLKESENEEVEVCCHDVSSRCIETLLPVCNDHSIVERFMTSFAQDKKTVCTSPQASHITEVLIHIALKNLKNYTPDFALDSDTPEGRMTTTSILWLTDFANFICENFSSCLTNTYSCHVACTLIRALAGDLSNQQSFMSKNTVTRKQQFRQSYIGETTSEKSQFYEPVTLEEVPKFFVDSLKRIAKALMMSSCITEFVAKSSAATVIEALLLSLKKRAPNRNKKLIKFIASNLFEAKDENGIPHAFLHEISSYVVEELFKVADEKVLLYLWEQYVADCLDKLIIHSVSNYIVQRLFDVVTSIPHFETMCQSTFPLFDEILKFRHFGIFVSIANACVNLKVQQAQFMKSLMQCLQCSKPEELQLQLIPRLLGFKNYEPYNGPEYSDSISICLQGSLVAQAVLKFHKPIKVVNSVLNMKPQLLSFVACNVQGSYLLHSYFDASNNVGEKNKKMLLKHLKPALPSMVCDKGGSLTLSRIWTLLSIKHKEIIMRELVTHQEELQQHRNGHGIIEKFGVFYYKKNYEEWKQMQENLTRRHLKKI